MHRELYRNMVEGAIDNEFEDAERSAEETLTAALEDIQTEPTAGGIALDLVTRQPLFIRSIAAETVVEYYETEEFDLASYKTHPYLPVRLDDTVYNCVYISGNPEQAHKPGNEYAFPRGRLMTVPVWGEDDE